MSNLVPFNQAALPAHLQQAAGSAKANLVAASGTGGASVDHISIKGAKFHIVRSGQQPVTLELFRLQVIIVHANPGMTKSLFEGAWNPDADAEAPICSSDDGVAPRADSEKPQCATCAACPQNQFGSKINPQTQKQTKACQDKKTIAVVTPGAAGGEMLRLQIPAASLKDFGNYLRSLPVAYHYVITEVSFDTTVSYPKLLFKPVDYVSAEEVATVDARHISDEAKAMAGVAGYTGAPVGAPINALPTPPAHLIAHQQIEQPVQQHVVQPTKTPEQIQMEALQAQLAALQGTVAQQNQPVQQPVVQQPEPVVQQPLQVAPLSDAPQPQDPSVAAIFGGQAAVVQPAAVVQQSTPVAQGNVHPSGREYGKPAEGRKRRTKVEMAEDAAVGIGAAAGEQSEEDDTAQAQVAQQQIVQPGKTPEQLALEAQLAALQAQLAAAQQTPVVQQTQPVQQPAQGGFGQATQQQAQPIHQPANQPQVMTGGAADAFAGWDD